MQAGDISSLLSDYWQLYLNGALATILLSVIGTLGGLFLGVFLAFGKKLRTQGEPWYKQLWKWPIKALCNVYSIVIRGTPMMVQAMIFKYSCQAMGINWNNVLKGVDTWNGWLIAGLIVITFNTAAYMGEIIQAGLNGVDKGQIEGAKSLGMTDMQTLFSVTLPQAIRNSIPTIGNEWIVNIKDSSVLNVISVSELYWQAQSAASRNYKYMATYIIIAIIYLTLTLLTTALLKFVEHKMDGKKPSNKKSNKNKKNLTDGLEEKEQAKPKASFNFTRYLFHYHVKKEA